MIKESLRIPLMWTAMGLVFVGAAVWFSYVNFSENLANPHRLSGLVQDTQPAPADR